MMLEPNDVLRNIFYGMASLLGGTWCFIGLRVYGSIKELNEKIAAVISRLEGHEYRISFLEKIKGDK